MDIPSWYAFILGCIIVAWRLIYFIYRLLTLIWRLSMYFILKHIAYPHLFRQIPVVGTATRLEILVGILYLATNCVVIGVGSSAGIGTRAALMSTINMIPLLCGPRLTLMTELLGISRRAHIGLHKWLGRTVIGQVGIHAISSVMNNQPFQWTEMNIYGVVGGSAFGFLLIFSLHFIRRLLYEWFLRSHFLLSVIALVAIWRHIASRNTVGHIFLQIGVYLWTAMAILHWLYFGFRNLALGVPFATAQVTKLENALRVDIAVPRPWNVNAGQIVFLSVPGAGKFSGFQSHPFMIAWWERSVDGLTISLLVKPRHGFTKGLSDRGNKTYLAFVDGPYGVKQDFGEYGTVLMFATGIGIAAQMPFIKELIRGYNSCEVRTHRILLVWQMDYEYQEDWAKPWMDEMILEDTAMIVEHHLYVLHLSNSKDVKPDKAIDYSDHGKLDKIFGPVKVRPILENEFGKRKGKMMVSICTKNDMSDEIRGIVQENMDKDVCMVELDFEPSSRQTRNVSHADMEFSCKGIA